MNNTQLRAARKQAREQATTEGYDNINLQIKQVKSGKMVMNSRGKYVEEIVPMTTYTAVHKPNSYGAIYSSLKKRG